MQELPAALSYGVPSSGQAIGLNVPVLLPWELALSQNIEDTEALNLSHTDLPQSYPAFPLFSPSPDPNSSFLLSLP